MLAHRGLEFMCVMRAERPNPAPVCLKQFPDATPVAFGHLEPCGRYPLHQPAAGVSVRLYRVSLTVVAVRVPAVQQPSVIYAQGNSAMPTRMSGEREQDKLGLSNLNRRRAVQPKPLIALKAMGLPLGAMGAMFGPIRPPLHERPRVKTGLQFVSEEMDGRCREIGQPARVIQVQVRQKDVSHLCRVVTPRFDLPDSCFVQVTGAADKTRELPHVWRGSDAITHSPAGINQR